MKQFTNLQTEWDLTKLLKNDADPVADELLKTVEEESYKFINKWKKRTDFLENPTILAEALNEYENWVRYFGTDGTPGYYYWLRSQQEQDNPEIRAKVNKISDLSEKISNDIDFFTHRLARVPKDKQELFLSTKQLQNFKHFLKGLFDNAKYLLSEEEEKILTLTSRTSHSNWTKMVSTLYSKEEAQIVDATGKKQKATFSEIVDTMRSPNKSIRDKAAKEFNKILVKHIEIAENEMNSVLQYKKVNDELRKIERPDLVRHISDDIETEVVDTLIESVSKRFNISTDFYKLKAQLLGQEKLEYHERIVDYGNIETNYSYERSVNLVYKVLNRLDPQFGDIVEQFITNGHVDVFPKKGKRGGAFCVHNQKDSPIFIFLNHTDGLDDVLTLAHEIGHGINDALMSKVQPALYCGTSLATAEVASTFMEDFVLEELKKEANDETRLALMMMKLNSDVSTIQRQVACYIFEQQLHQEFREKGYLSKKEIGSLFQRHMASYMGDFVEQSKGSENWWAYWGHIRRFFYNYSYANGLLISKALQNEVKRDPEFISKVKQFLSAGTSKAPKDIFLDIDIDITNKAFWNKGLDEIETLVTETKTLAKKLGKI